MKHQHILIVGDPGMGKSQMLNAATQLAARSVYVGGNTASTTGLTVTLTKEEGGETGIEAGALVLADQGVACIDELDKCKHLDGLLEAMEQQQVSIAKAGVVASLPARCSVIAAANPKHGSYNMSKTVAENLNISRPILSRFDLVFILRDRANKDQDRLVSSNIINLYRRQGVEGGASGSSTSTLDVTQETTAQLAEKYLSNDKENTNAQSSSTQDPFPQGPAVPPRRENRVPLEQRLAWVAGFNQALPADLVRDYIAYAREFCKPKLTVEAAEILQEYYMDLRYPSNGRHRKDTVPITTRQLEALIRLSQARAKSCLREFVLREDALDVVDLLKQSVEQVHTDEYGIVDRTRAGAAGLSNRKMRKLFIKEVQTIIGVGAECSLDDLRRVADRIECSISEFQTMIEDMRENGMLLRKPDGGYKVMS
jgi:DNA helicase MCM8